MSSQNYLFVTWHYSNIYLHGVCFLSPTFYVSVILWLFFNNIFLFVVYRLTAHYGEYKWAVYRMLKVLSFARNILQMLCFLSTVSVFPWAKMTLCHLLWRSLWRRFALKTLTYCSLLCTIILKFKNEFWIQEKCEKYVHYL